MHWIISLAIVIIYLTGILTGIPIGLVLDDFLHRWSKQIVLRIERKLGWEEKKE